MSLQVVPRDNESAISTSKTKQGTQADSFERLIIWHRKKEKKKKDKNKKQK
uniref:Uncharacterized protein n=1 Tax=Candidozyma auris TaxID=498019 RepID=A0A0L0P8G8_CANAR